MKDSYGKLILFRAATAAVILFLIRQRTIPFDLLAMVIGIPVGIVGMVLVALAYPVYNRVLKKQRARIAPEILRLTDELLK